MVVGQQTYGALGQQFSDFDDEVIPSPLVLYSLVKERIQVVRYVLGSHIGAALSIEGGTWG